MRTILLLLAASSLLLQACGRSNVAEDHHPTPHDREMVFHEQIAVLVEHGDTPAFVPPGHLPPPGHARVWYLNRPPGHQPPPFRLD